MKHPFRFSILPYFTVGAGILGLCLRLWLFAATDEKGLLPASHPADALVYLLTALTLGILFLASREAAVPPIPGKTLRRWDAAGNLLGGLGLILAVFVGANTGTSSPTGLYSISCLICGLILLLIGTCALQKKLPQYWLYALVTVALMLLTVSQCRAWGAQPQLQRYIFPLLTFVFAILTAYFRTLQAADRGKPALLAFFSQSCLFCACLSLNDSRWPMYLGLLCWASAQLVPCFRAKRRS